MGNKFNTWGNDSHKEALLMHDHEFGKTSIDSHLDENHEYKLDTKKTYSIWVAICFVLNYGIGSGVLGLPKEYSRTGLVLASFLMLWMGWLAYCTYMWIVDAMIRAKAIKHLSRQSVIENFADNPDSVLRQLRGTSILELRSHYTLDHIEYELNELIGIFCGRRLRILYEILFAIATMMELCSYCTLFGVSMARHFGISGISHSCDITIAHHESCRHLYSFYVGLFWIWTMFITSFSFPSQATYQAFSSIMRFIIMFLMLFTSIGLMYSAYYYQDGHFYKTDQSNPHYGPGLVAFNWSRMASFLGIAGFAYGNQFCASDVLAPLRPEDRGKQKILWGSSVLISGLTFMICGAVIAAYYGTESESPCTLAWDHFQGFLYKSSAPAWAETLSTFIVIFPAFDMLSTYPLNAITTANTLQAALLSEKRRHNKYWKRAVRYAICAVTNIFAMLVWNFDFMVSATGAFLIITVYGGTALMEHYGKKVCQELTNDENAYITPITDTKFVSTKFMIFACLVTSVVAFVGVFVSFII